MIKILLLFCFACGLMAVGAFVVEEKGYVLISVADWTWEASLFGFALLLLAIYISVVLLSLIIRSVFNARKNWRAWRVEKKQSRSLNSLQNAIEALLNQQWQKAEQQSLKHAKNSPISSSHYLIAAEAARQQNHNDDSSVYLLRAQQSGNETDKQLAICKSLVQEGKSEQAIKNCEALLATEPKHSENLLMLARLYQQTQQHEALREILSKVKRYTDITEPEFRQMAIDTFEPLFKQAEKDKNLKLLQQYNKALHKFIEQDTHSVKMYLVSLNNAGFHKELEAALIKLFDTEINRQNIVLFNQLDLHQPLKLTAWIEKQIKNQPNNAQLKVLLAVAAGKNNDLQLAQQALESALHQHPEQIATAENYALLGDIYSQQNQDKKAISCYQKGVSLAASANL